MLPKKKRWCETVNTASPIPSPPSNAVPTRTIGDHLLSSQMSCINKSNQWSLPPMLLPTLDHLMSNGGPKQASSGRGIGVPSLSSPVIQPPVHPSVLPPHPPNITTRPPSSHPSSTTTPSQPMANLSEADLALLPPVLRKDVTNFLLLQQQQKQQSFGVASHAAANGPNAALLYTANNKQVSNHLHQDPVITSRPRSVNSYVREPSSSTLANWSITNHNRSNEQQQRRAAADNDQLSHRTSPHPATLSVAPTTLSSAELCLLQAVAQFASAGPSSSIASALTEGAQAYLAALGGLPLPAANVKPRSGGRVKALPDNAGDFFRDAKPGDVNNQNPTIYSQSPSQHHPTHHNHHHHHHHHQFTPSSSPKLPDMHRGRPPIVDQLTSRVKSDPVTHQLPIHSTTVNNNNSGGCDSRMAILHNAKLASMCVNPRPSNQFAVNNNNGVTIKPPRARSSHSYTSATPFPLPDLAPSNCSSSSSTSSWVSSSCGNPHPSSYSHKRLSPPPPVQQQPLLAPSNAPVGGLQQQTTLDEGHRLMPLKKRLMQRYRADQSSSPEPPALVKACEIAHADCSAKRDDDVINQHPAVVTTKSHRRTLSSGYVEYKAEQDCGKNTPSADLQPPLPPKSSPFYPAVFVDTKRTLSPVSSAGTPPPPSAAPIKRPCNQAAKSSGCEAVGNDGIKRSARLDPAESLSKRGGKVKSSRASKRQHDPSPSSKGEQRKAKRVAAASVASGSKGRGRKLKVITGERSDEEQLGSELVAMTAEQRLSLEELIDQITEPPDLRQLTYNSLHSPHPISYYARTKQPFVQLVSCNDPGLGSKQVPKCRACRQVKTPFYDHDIALAAHSAAGIGHGRSCLGSSDEEEDDRDSLASSTASTRRSTNARAAKSKSSRSNDDGQRSVKSTGSRSSDSTKPGSNKVSKTTLTQQQSSPISVFCRFWGFRKLCFNERGSLKVVGFCHPTEASQLDRSLWEMHYPNRSSNLPGWSSCTTTRQQHSPDGLLLTCLLPASTLGRLFHRLHRLANFHEIQLGCDCPLVQVNIDGSSDLLHLLPKSPSELARLTSDLTLTGDDRISSTQLLPHQQTLPYGCQVDWLVPRVSKAALSSRQEAKYRLLRLPAPPDSQCQLDAFNSQWVRNRPIVVANCHRDAFNRNLWTPSSFAASFGSQRVSLIDCANGVEHPRQSLKVFLDSLSGQTLTNSSTSRRGKDIHQSHPPQPPPCFKLKDWPSTEDFAELQPQRFADFMHNLPLGDLTSREGELNLASRLPGAFIVCPDLGPKLYLANGTVGTKAVSTTNLHIDIADAVNILLYAGGSHSTTLLPSRPSSNGNRGSSSPSAPSTFSMIGDLVERSNVDANHVNRIRRWLDQCQNDSSSQYNEDDVPGALWHIFLAEDLPELRAFLTNDIRSQQQPQHQQHVSEGSDPIHDQTFYLDQAVLDRLYDATGILPCSLVQFVGDAVFIPAGAAHQVRNLNGCIKAAVDFVSPSNLSQCLDLIEQFRRLSPSHQNHEDKLQVKNMLFHAVKDALTVLARSASNESAT